MKPLLLILFCIPLLIFGQNFRQAVINTETGGYLVFSDDTRSFTIHLDTAIIEPYGEQSTMYLIIDNTYVLQLFSIPFKNPDNLDLLDDEIQKDFLAQYMKYETEYFRTDLNLSLKNLKTKWGTINLRRFLNWEFETPEFETVDTQIHLTTICFDNFVNINVPVTPGMPRSEAFAFIQWVASRLEMREEPIDFDAFAKEVNGLD